MFDIINVGKLNNTENVSKLLLRRYARFPYVSIERRKELDIMVCKNKCNLITNVLQIIDQDTFHASLVSIHIFFFAKQREGEWKKFCFYYKQEKGHCLNTLDHNCQQARLEVLGKLI